MIALTFPEFVAVWNATRQGQATPTHMARIARWLDARWQAGDRRLLLMAFRSSGKSTLAALFAAWLLRCQPDLRLLVLAADLTLAEKMVRNTKRVIERHPATRGLKPARPDQWAADRFTVRRPTELRDPSMLARGVQANLTGSRADAVICDDVEVPNTSDTAAKRADLRTRLAEVDYVLTPGGLQLYIGTPHSPDTIYADAPGPDGTPPFLAGFRRLKIPLLDADGRSAWPERFTEAQATRLKRQTGPAKFASQMQLEAMAITRCRLDPDRLRLYEGELDYREGGGRPVLPIDGTQLVSAACWWDPAFGAADDEGGDGSVVATVFSAADGRSFLHRIQWLNRTRGVSGDADGADEATRQCRMVARLAAELLVPAVAVETNGLGRFLPGVLRKTLAAEGVAAAVIEQASHIPKDRRILEAFDARLAAGSLCAHRSVFSSPLIGEMRDWRPGQTRGHDDGLDAVAGALSLEPVRLGSPQRPAGRPDWRRGAVHQAATIFEP